VRFEWLHGHMAHGFGPLLGLLICFIIILAFFRVILR
jgi:hypothetical protein